MEVDSLERGKIYLREGKLEKAQIIIRKVLNENPNRAKALELFGDLAVKLGDYNEGIKRYERAGNIYMDNNQYTEAIMCFEKILKFDRTKNELFLSLAQLYKAIDLPNEAIKKILEFCSTAMNNKEEGILLSGSKEIINLQPNNLPLRLSYIKILFATNRAAEAEGELNELKKLAEEAHDEQIINEVNKLLPQYDGAEEELDPKSRIELGKLLYEIGSKDEALVEFNRAVNDLLKNGEEEEAFKLLNRIIEIDPDNSEATNKLKELKPEPEKDREEEVLGLETLEVKKEESAESTPDIELLQAQVEELEAISKSEEAKAKSEEIVEAMPSLEGLGTKAGEDMEAIPNIEELETKIEETAETIPGIEEIEVKPEEPTEVISEISELETKPEEPTPASTAESIEFLQELSKEVEGFVAASEVASTTPSLAEELPPLEGQIADIEFLLREAEAKPPAPSFELTQAFDDFQNNIHWVTEDTNRKIALAKSTFDAELYEATISYLQDIKDKKEYWPLLLELFGGSFVKLGRYNEAIRNIRPATILKEISKQQKLELRYLLASAYEGLGDFVNALGEIEQIMEVNPDYKDAREIYELLGGKKIYEKPYREIEKGPEEFKERVEEEVLVKPVTKLETTEMEVKEKPIRKKIDEIKPKELKPERLPEEMAEVEEQEERISFL